MTINKPRVGQFNYYFQNIINKPDTTQLNYKMF